MATYFHSPYARPKICFGSLNRKQKHHSKYYLLGQDKFFNQDQTNPIHFQTSKIQIRSDTHLRKTFPKSMSIRIK